MPVARKVPLRKCVGCQEMFPKKQLIRIVLTPEGDIVLDATGKRNGRGAYLCNNVSCLRQAQKRKSLDRALKVSIPQPLYSHLQALMEGALPTER